MIDPYLHITNNFPEVQQNIPLASLTSMGIGGTADLYCKITDTAKLAPLVDMAKKHEIPTVILAGGSNMVFADQGFQGLVIHLATRGITLENNIILAAEGGTLLSQVIQFALKNSLTGIEQLMGLPGTIGGAVRGNAGAFGKEIQDIFQKALLYSPTIGLHEEQKQYFNFGYRTSTIKTTDDIVLKVWLQLKPTTPEAAQAALADATNIIKNRISKQPKGKSSGSFFKNPIPPDYAAQQDKTTKVGYLLEQCDCKGLRIGDAQVSKEHANWIMNLGSATQQDVLALAREMQTRVKQKFGIDLEPEVQFISNCGPLDHPLSSNA